MEGKGILEESLKQAFETHEMPVRPELWSGIQAQVAANAAAGSVAASAASTGAFSMAATMVGIVSILTVATISEVRIQSTVSEEVAVTTEQTIEVAPENVAVSFEEAEISPQPIDRQPEESKEIAISTAEPLSTVDAVAAYPEATGEEMVALPEKAGPEQPMQKGKSKDAPDSKEPNNSTAKKGAGTSPKSKSEDGELALNGAQAQKEPAVNQPSNQPKVPVTSEGPDPEENDQLEEEPKLAAEFYHEPIVPMTPNGDGINDYFELESSNVEQFKILIYTKQGVKVFESNDPHFKWDGRDQMGNILPRAEYYYEIRAVGFDGQPFNERNSRGRIDLFRDF